MNARKMTRNSRTAENAHQRLDVLEPRVGATEKWQKKRDKNTDRLFYAVIGAFSFHVLDTMGLLEFIKFVS